jgi:glycosyltransferase involved in cell wall biosynthesis
VQIESMLNGTPVVASNLPGVRVPVETTGMGFVVPIGNTKALASAIGVTLRRPHEYQVPRQEVEKHFSVRRTADGYLQLYERLVREAVIIPYQALLLSRVALLFGLITFFVALFFPWRRGE